MSIDRNRALEPTTEEEMAQAHVNGMPAIHNATIVLVEYDSNWPALYAGEEAKIRAALGERVVQIEHVGSTSVPGLCAKPIIDIDLAVPDTRDEDAYVPALLAAGYALHAREPEWFEHRLFKGVDPAVNLHVFTAGCSEIDRMTRFRDWMRTHPEDRDLYANAKRDLAQRTWKYTQHYADAKTNVVAEIVARAEAAR